MGKHTIGPWRSEFGNNHACVVAKLEHEVARVHMLRSTNAEENANRDVMIANARLIAAAPELLGADDQASRALSAAREMLLVFEDHGGHDGLGGKGYAATLDQIDGALAALRSARAKAGGQ